jgi:SpoVK/Ycf46/Vps4 family AAA+-type ATPase
MSNSKKSSDKRKKREAAKMAEEVSTGGQTSPQSIDFKNPMDEVLVNIKAQVPIIWVVTHEEGRFIEDFEKTIPDKTRRRTYIWSGHSGIATIKEYKAAVRASGQMDKTWMPNQMLQKVLEIAPDQEKESGITYILRDFHTVLHDQTARQIRDMYDHMAGNGKTLLIMSPFLAHPGGSGIHPTLEKQIVVVHYNLPTREQIEARVRANMDLTKKNLPQGKVTKTKVDYTDAEYLEISRALQGLTVTEIENAISSCLSHMLRLDPERLIKDKRQIVRKSGILEFIDTKVETKDVGGLDLAKDYLVRYSNAHTKEAQAFGVEPLKGVLFTGIPGTGKSLLAKALGHLWKIPLLRLDMGKVMDRLVGSSEDRMRQVISVAEAMAPCIVWIDEIEKGLSGTKSSNFSDGGTLARVFGTLLTAMAEGMKGVTMIATANDITMLPPELIRRFNEVFFVDLPGPDERWQILGIHLGKRGRDLKNFTSFKKEFLEASDGYTGAELEKAVSAAIASAFYAGEKDVKTNHILDVIKDTKPISKIQGEKIVKLQKWALDHARYASSYSAAQTKKNADKIRATAVDMEKTVGDIKEMKTSAEKKRDAVEAAENNPGRKIEVE